GSFCVNAGLGWITTLTILTHEIPQEIEVRERVDMTMAVMAMPPMPISFQREEKSKTRRNPEKHSREVPALSQPFGDKVQESAADERPGAERDQD
ncbi:zinc transporter, partial [Candidatus Termititenax persephonae]